MVDVSDHAVLRYLQRVKGVDVEDIRRTLGDMLSARVPKGISDAVVTIDGISFTIKDGVLVTLYRRRATYLRDQLDEAHRGK